MSREYSNPFFGKNYIEQEKSIVNKWLALFGVTFVVPMVFGMPIFFKMVQSGCGLYLAVFAGVFGSGIYLNLKLALRIGFESGILYKNFGRITPDYNFTQEEATSILFMHILNLKRMWKRSGRKAVSQDSLIEVIHAKLKNEGSPILLFSNIMITIGLIGTISGLITSIGGLSVTSGGGSIMDGLGSALDGVGVAFYTTLVGSILGGVSLRVLHFYVDKKIDSYILALAEIVEISVVPAYRKNQDETDLRNVSLAVMSLLENQKERKKGVLYEVA